MKKTIFAIAGLSMLAFVACKDDKKTPEPIAPTPQQLIVNKWSAVYFGYDQNHNGTLESNEKDSVTSPHDAVMLNLLQNGVGTATSYEQDTASAPTTTPLTYKISDNGKKFTYGNATDSATFDVLILNDSVLYLFNYITEDTVQTGQWIYFKKV